MIKLTDKTLTLAQLRQLTAATWMPWLYASLPDAMLVAGGSSLTYGAWLVYPPAGFIVAGVLLIGAAFLAARKLG